jgi:hypothetical protein
MKKLMVLSLLCLGFEFSTRAAFAQCSAAAPWVHWNLSQAVGPNVKASVTHKLHPGCSSVTPGQMHVDLVTTTTACSELVTFTYSEGSTKYTNYYYLSAPVNSADHLDQNFTSTLVLGSEIDATSFSVSFGGSCPGAYEAITFAGGSDAF